MTDDVADDQRHRPGVQREGVVPVAPDLESRRPGPVGGRDHDLLEGGKRAAEETQLQGVGHVALSLVQERVVEREGRPARDLTGDGRRHHRPPVRAGRDAEGQRPEAVPARAEREHEQRPLAVAHGRGRCMRARFLPARHHVLDPLGPALVVLELGRPGAAARDLVDDAVLVGEVNRHERRAVAEHLVDDPQRPPLHRRRLLERLTEEREEGAVLRHALGLGLQLGAFQRDPRLLGQAEEQWSAVRRDPAPPHRSGEDRSDDIAPRRSERQRGERLGAQLSSLLRERRIPGVVLVARVDRHECARGHRVRHDPPELERIHAEAIVGLVRHGGRRERLQPRRVAERPDEHDVRAERLDLPHGRGRDLGAGGGGGEPRGMPLHQLRLEACVALPFEQSGSLERAGQLLGDRIEHPPLVEGQQPVLVERHADGARGAWEGDDDHRGDVGKQPLELGGIGLADPLVPVQLDRCDAPASRRPSAWRSSAARASTARRRDGARPEP